ncbi:MAG: hypothetical protein IJM97_03475 [Clostridia bacterium]|nr:hypothetical protein [Clostridia bacterium]
MAKCPNCGVKIGIFDWRPNCKNCGVNLVYFDIEKRLLADSERAEKEHREFVMKTARVKAAFIGSSSTREKVLAILRIILTLLPVGAFFLPLVKIATNIPFYTNAMNVNAIGIYELMSTFNFGGFFKAIGSDLFGTPSIYLLISIVTTALMVIGIVLNLLLITLACSPKGKPRTLSLSVINIVLAVLSVVFFNLAGTGYTAVFGAETFSTSIGIGSYLAIGLLVLTLAINIVLFSKKFAIQVKYPEIVPLGYKQPKKKKKSPLDNLFKKNKKKEAKEEAKK